MSLLDKFLILFETDSSEAGDDVDKLNKKLDETEDSANDAVDSMDVAAESAGDLGVSFSDAATKAAGFIGAFVAIESVIRTSVAVAQQTDKLGKLAETYGLNIEQLDAWGAAVERNGGNAQEFQNAVVGMQTQLDQIQFGGGAEIVKTLGMMGVSATNANGEIKSTFDILTELSGTMEGMSASKAASIGQVLGLDQGTILMLQQGKKSIQDLVEQQTLLGGATNESYKASADFNDSVDNMDRAFTGLWQTINAAILPIFTSLTDGISDLIMWFRDNKEFSVAFFTAIAAAITGVLFPAIMSLTAAAAPWLAIGAAVVGVSVAIAALVEDIYAFTQGQKSLTGDFVNWITEGLDEAKAMFNEFISWLKSMFDLDFIGERISDALSGVKDFFGLGDDEQRNGIMANTNMGLAMAGMYNTSPMNTAGQPSAFGNRNVYNTNSFSFNNQIEAKGVTPEQVSGQMSNEFGRQISSAAAEFDDGVDY